MKLVLLPDADERFVEPDIELTNRNFLFDW
jgi:hypothetical protein